MPPIFIPAVPMANARVPRVLRPTGPACALSSRCRIAAIATISSDGLRALPFASATSAIFPGRAAVLSAVATALSTTTAATGGRCRSPMAIAAGPAASSNSATEPAWVRADKSSDVDARCQGVVLDELPAGLNQIAHQLVEEHVGLIDLLDAHLQQRACIGVEG